MHQEALEIPAQAIDVCRFTLTDLDRVRAFFAFVIVK